jgi:hypothetical protein
MDRKRTIGLCFGSLFIVGVGAFYLGGALTPPRTIIPTTSDSIIAEAKQRVPLPTLPPKPGGHVVTEIKTIEQTVQVPVVTFQRGPLGIKIPITTLQTQTTHQNVPTSTLIDASPQETAAWEAEVKKLQDQYNLALQVEIKKISREKELASAKETADFIKQLITDAIVPVVLALAGLVGAIVSLVQAFKAKPKTNVPD